MTEAMHEASLERNMARAAQPQSLLGYIKWARWAYEQEPPKRLHQRSLSDAGTPNMTGEFVAWLKDEKACATDGDRYYRTPFRCAVSNLAGRYPGTPNWEMARFAYAIAATDGTLDQVVSNIEPSWVRTMVAEKALMAVWSLYDLLPVQRHA